MTLCDQDRGFFVHILQEKQDLWRLFGPGIEFWRRGQKKLLEVIRSHLRSDSKNTLCRVFKFFNFIMKSFEAILGEYF